MQANQRCGAPSPIPSPPEKAVYPLLCVRVARSNAGAALAGSCIVRAMATSALTRRHGEEIRRIARSHGAVRVRVFGSHATGTATDASDVDLLVELEPGRDLLDLIALKQDVEALLGRTVDVVEEGGLSPYLRDRILQEARSL